MLAPKVLGTFLLQLQGGSPFVGSSEGGGGGEDGDAMRLTPADKESSRLRRKNLANAGKSIAASSTKVDECPAMVELYGCRRIKVNRASWCTSYGHLEPLGSV